MTPLCRAEDSLVICIDVQERLVASLPEASAERTLENIVRVLKTAGLLGVPVFYAEQYPEALGATVAPVAEALPPTAQRFAKSFFSCCAQDDFLQAMRATHKRQAILIGMETHIAVLQTAVELAEQGMEVFVIDDAVASRRLAHWKSALLRLRQAGIIVSLTESLLFEWLRASSHEHFNKVSWFLR